MKLRGTVQFIRRHWILFAFAFFLICFLSIPHMLERLFIYYPAPDVQTDPGSVGLGYQDIFFITEDKVRLHGWFIPCNDAARTLMIFHGNAGNIGDRVEWIEMLHSLNVHLFIFDYRGYGKSEGKPFEEGLYRDARAAWQWWKRERQSRGEKLILMGESLGGAVAVNLAGSVSPDGLVIQSTFTSGRDMAATSLLLRLLFPFAGVHFDSAKTIGRVLCPKLFIHGMRDEIIPFHLGKTLYDLAPPPKSFYPVPKAGHNDLPWVSTKEYLQQLALFISGIQN
jgi:fermentation-respiration switch protein FrsA (DUF1100 family)